MKIPAYVPVIVTLLALLAVFGDKIPGIDWPSGEPDAVTYVYEKSDHALPSYVTVALNKLNRQGILATYYEVDTTDADGDVPEQYKVPSEVAKKEGMPALVVTDDGKLVRVVKDPKTEADVLEAVK